ncbi:MAG TPA: TolC family protein [Gemmatimonadaceae bacterium]|nr:TolC family protein [Gemmatimonadaceae bacterium]
MKLLSRRAYALWLLVSGLPITRLVAQQPVSAPCPPGRIVASACPVGALTLADAVAMAQERGLSAEASRNALVAARARNAAFNARLLPQLSVGGTAVNYNHAIVSQPDSGTTKFFSQSQNESTMGVSISQPLPWLGSTLSVGSYLDRLDLTGTASSGSRIYTSTPFLISLHQDFLKPRELLWSTRAQDIRANLAERQYLESREDVAIATGSAFFDYYAANVAVRNATANAAVNDTLYTLNKGRFEVGKIGENDLLQSELQLLRARASLDGAKLERDRSESALRRLINVHASDTLVVVAPQDIPNVEVDPEVAVSEALRNSSVSEQALLDSVAARRGVTEARLNNFFGASIDASYGVNQTNSLFSQAYASPLPRQSVQMQVSMPVFQWGGGRADVQAARADQAVAASSARARREQLIEDARYAALQLTQSERMLLIAAKADTVAQKRFEVAKNRYVIGKIGVSDLYIAQNEKDQALDAYVLALRSYWINYYRLRRVTLYNFEEKAELR